MVKKVAIYARVSTLEQAEEGYSLEEQVSKLTKYAEVQDWKVSKIYRDGGFSGANTERPELQNLIADATLKEFDIVLVYKLDRLSRSQRDTLYLIEDVFNKNDISFVSLSEAFDTSTAFGKAMIGILAVFAQLEREQIKERMTLGKLGRAKSGKTSSWSRAPFGYRFNEKRELELDPIQAPIVKKMFENYLNGMSVTKIWKTLNEEGHIGKDVKWSYRTVSAVLQNPIYAGYTKYKGQLFEGIHEEIISKEMYEKVKLELEERRKKVYSETNNHQPFQTKYMLSGMVRCKNCNSMLAIRLNSKRKDGTRSIYYKCLGQIKYKKQKTNPIRTNYANPCDWDIIYRKEDLEKAVIDELEKIRKNPSLIYKQAKKQKDITEIDSEKINKEISLINNKLNKLLDLYLENELSKEEYTNRIGKLQLEKNILADRLKSKDNKSVEELVEYTKTLEFDLHDLSEEDQKIVVKKLVSKVLVEKNKIDIYLRF